MLARLLALAASLVLALTAGIWLGGHPDRLPGPVRDAFVSDDTAAVGEALGVLHRRYYRDPNSKRVSDAAIKGAVDSLKDPYSQYIAPRELQAFNDQTDARFEGIGVEVQRAPEGLEIMRVYDGSPAKKAGLRGGDLIVRAAGKSLRGMTSNRSTGLIRGPAGTSVRLTIQRGKERFTRRVGRARVRVPVVAAKYEAAQRVGVARLGAFTTGAHGEVLAAIRRLEKRGARSIVLDLRGNPGGLVEESQLVSSLFLKGGAVVTMKGRAVRSRTLKAGNKPQFPKLPVVVLVDGNSASASEIVTGALQDRGRATVVGTRTFGKGVFQEVLELGSGGALDITVGQFFTPKGRNFGGAGVVGGKDVSRGKGLVPDVRAVDDPKTPRIDEALDRAVQIAKSKQR